MDRPGVKDDVFRFATFDVDALCQLASRLRDGVLCTCDLDQSPAKGSFNWAIFVSFEDGVEWVLRSPHSNPDIPTLIPGDVCAKLLESEVATLKYIDMHTDIPVPTVFSYSPTAENDIGIPYILMSKATGYALSTFWSNEKLQKLHPEAKWKVLCQLGRLTWSLAQHRFDRIGSLFHRDGSFEIGECLSRGHLLYQRHSLETISRGPFAPAAGFYESLISAFIEHVETLPMTSHCFIAPNPSRTAFESLNDFRDACALQSDSVSVGQKLDSADNRVDYVIAGQMAGDLLNQWRQTKPEAALSKPFPLHHPDLSVNNIFVVEDYRITCIIDWAFCTTVPLDVLLAPPGLPQSRDQLDESLIRVFQDGFRLSSQMAPVNEDEALISTNAARLLEGGQFIWSFIRLTGFDSTDDYRLLCGLWNRIHRSDGSCLGTYLSSRRASSQDWYVYEMIHDEDEPAEEISRKEEVHFGNNKFELAIARKLTFVSDWNAQYLLPSQECIRGPGQLFMADEKLWRWLLEFKRGTRLCICDIDLHVNQESHGYSVSRG